MNVDTILSRINWRQIAAHLLATFFLILAARQFTVLNDIGIVVAADKYGFPDAWHHLAKEDNFSSRIAYFTLWNNFSVLFGLLFSLIISLGLTLKKRGFWLNTIIMLLIAILFNRLGLFDNKIIDKVFFSFGNLFASIGLQFKFVANGTLLTFIGLFIFFSKWTSSFAFDNK